MDDRNAPPLNPLPPVVWALALPIIAMEVVLGIDNLIFISILTNKLPAEHRERARRIGIGCALAMRLLLLGTIAIIVQLTEPVIELFGHGLSWRDLILIAGGLVIVAIVFAIVPVPVLSQSLRACHPFLSKASQTSQDTLCLLATRVGDWTMLCDRSLHRLVL